MEKSILKRKRQIFLLEYYSQTSVHLPIYSVKPVQTVDFIKYLFKCGLFTEVPHQGKIKWESQWEIYGDNLDHRVHTSHMTRERRGEDIHWFLLVGAPLRVHPPEELNKSRPRRNILNVDNCEFLPSVEDSSSLQQSFIFHIMETLVKFIPFLQGMSKAVPEYIPHQHVREMSKKSPCYLMDVLNKSENKGKI